MRELNIDAAQKNKRQLVIGLGSGRSGTNSLSRLLGMQPSSFFVHEGSFRREKIILPWKKNADLVDRLFELLERESKGAKFYGCVAFYFLPYVEDILEKYPQAKFVRLARSRSAVVESFLVHSGNYNWWMNHDGTIWEKNSVWDLSFPKFAAASKKEAVEKYWDFYYEQSLVLEKKYPENFKIFDTECLNTRAGMNGIFDFVGYPAEGRVFKIVHSNSIHSAEWAVRKWIEAVRLGHLYRFLKKIPYRVKTYFNEPF